MLTRQRQKQDGGEDNGCSSMRMHLSADHQSAKVVALGAMAWPAQAQLRPVTSCNSGRLANTTQTRAAAGGGARSLPSVQAGTSIKLLVANEALRGVPGWA
jgi:hypothetical protein